MDINKLLSYALESGASDLHLSSGSIPMVRINGIMKPLNMSATSDEDMSSILPQVMNDDQIENFHNNKEIDFSSRLEGKGRFRKTPIWICETKDGKTFNVTPCGSIEYRKKLFLNVKKHIGQLLTVTYQELSKKGIPRFPIGKCIR